MTKEMRYVISCPVCGADHEAQGSQDVEEMTNKFRSNIYTIIEEIYEESKEFRKAHGIKDIEELRNRKKQ